MDKKWWTLTVVCAATFMLLLDVTIVIVALPEIQQGLHAGFSEAQWTINAYALTLASVLLTSGSLADRFGRRRLFVIGLSIFTAGSLLCGVAQSSLMLILSRSAQGIGGATLFATSLALLAQTFHGKERGVAFGAWGAITGVATGLGPVLGGVITTGISWRGIFLVNLPIGAAAILITLWKVDDPGPTHPARIDWAGFALLTSGLVSLTYGLMRAGQVGWSDSGTVTCLVIAGVLLPLFIQLEATIDHPMFDLKLFRVPTFSGGLLSALAMNGSLFSVFVYLVLYLQDDLRYSALGTGLRLLIVTAGSLVAATLAGRLSSHMPVRWLIGPGLVLVGVGLILMGGISSSGQWTHLIPGFIVAGVGSGMVNPPLASTAVGVVIPQRSGMASGVNTTFRQIGIALGIAVYGSIFTQVLGHRFTSALSGNAQLAGRSRTLLHTIEQGNSGQAFGSVPSVERGQLAAALHSSFASALNDILYVSAGLALVGGIGALLSIRSKDFVASQPAASESSESESSESESGRGESTESAGEPRTRPATV
ncbi:MAG: MFS transporter [Acidimicrobiales bacterium]|nr:MFS transporter [Acidimicrobiales bacterium]